MCLLYIVFLLVFFLYHSLMNKVAQNFSTEMISDGLFETAARWWLISKFHYTGSTGPARTFLRPRSPRNSVGSVRIRAGPVGSV